MELADYLDMLEPGRRRTALSAGLVLTPTGMAPVKAGLVTSRAAITSTNFAPKVPVASSSGGFVATPTNFAPKVPAASSGDFVVSPTNFAPPSLVLTPAPTIPTCAPGSFWDGRRCSVSFLAPGGGTSGGGADVPLVPPAAPKSSAPYWLGLLAVALVAKKYL